jgi:anti-anti-sigma factor
MDITTKEIKDVTVVRLVGRFDAYTAPAVKTKFLELQAAGQVKIVADLSSVDFVDSTGLATLVAGLACAHGCGWFLNSPDWTALSGFMRTRRQP